MPCIRTSVLRCSASSCRKGIGLGLSARPLPPQWGVQAGKNARNPFSLVVASKASAPKNVTGNLRPQGPPWRHLSTILKQLPNMETIVQHPAVPHATGTSKTPQFPPTTRHQPATPFSTHPSIKIGLAGTRQVRFGFGTRAPNQNWRLPAKAVLAGEPSPGTRQTGPDRYRIRWEPTSHLDDRRHIPGGVASLPYTLQTTTVPIALHRLA